MSEAASRAYMDQANKMLSREARLEDIVTLADVLAERDRLRAVVERVEDVVGRLNALSISAGPAGQVAYAHAAVMVDSVIRGSTDTRPAPATAQDAVQGAGDGV